jgi:hypothetical protein
VALHPGVERHPHAMVHGAARQITHGFGSSPFAVS